MLANKKLMMDPIIAQSGQTFEKEAYEQYVKTKGVDYTTGKKTDLSKIMKNLAIKNAILEFLSDNPWAYEYKENDSIDLIEF